MRKPRITQVDLDTAYANGRRQAEAEAGEREKRLRDSRRLQEEQLRTQSIDAICHAITALARLIDGRDAR